MTPERFAVLLAIKNLPPPVIESAIARYIFRKPNSVTLMVDRMTKDGLVERIRDLKDRRAIRIVITEKGESAYQKGLEVYAKLIPEVLSGLSNQEIKSFNSVMEKILSKISA